MTDEECYYYLLSIQNDTDKMLSAIFIIIGVGFTASLIAILSTIAVALARKPRKGTSDDATYRDEVDSPMSSEASELYRQLIAASVTLDKSIRELQAKVFEHKTPRYPETNLMRNSVNSLRKGNQAIQNLILNLGSTKYEGEHPHSSDQEDEETS